MSDDSIRAPPQFAQASPLALSCAHLSEELKTKVACSTRRMNLSYDMGLGGTLLFQGLTKNFEQPSKKEI